jgi:hypothetical protein
LLLSAKLTRESEKITLFLFVERSDNRTIVTEFFVPNQNVELAKLQKGM